MMAVRSLSLLCESLLLNAVGNEQQKQPTRETTTKDQFETSKNRLVVNCVVLKLIESVTDSQTT
jgi:hypothetical protein